MTLCVLNSEKLELLRGDLDRAPVARVKMEPVGRAYLTTVETTVDGVVFCLYAETHANPQVPADVSEAVTAFNASRSVWESLVAEALDAQDELLDQDREELDERVAQSQATRGRLLHR